MKTIKKLGVWVGHSNANLMEYPAESLKTKTITLKKNQQDDQQRVFRGEKMMHTKEQHLQSEYYNELGQAIEGYDDVILFGPTEAKAELLNILRADHRFAKTKIEIRQTDQMSEKQQHAFVRQYFNAG